MEICENVRNQCIKKTIFVTITVKLTYLRIFLHWEFFPNSSVSGIYQTVASMFLKLNKIYRDILRRIFKGWSNSKIYTASIFKENGVQFLRARLKVLDGNGFRMKAGKTRVSVRTNTYTLFSTHSVPLWVSESLHKIIWNWCSFQKQWKAVLQ